MRLKKLVTDKNKNAPCHFIVDKFYDIDVVDIKKNYQIIKKLKIFKLNFFLPTNELLLSIIYDSFNFFLCNF